MRNNYFERLSFFYNITKLKIHVFEMLKDVLHKTTKKRTNDMEAHNTRARRNFIGLVVIFSLKLHLYFRVVSFNAIHSVKRISNKLIPSLKYDSVRSPK